MINTWKIELLDSPDMNLVVHTTKNAFIYIHTPSSHDSAVSGQLRPLGGGGGGGSEAIDKTIAIKTVRNGEQLTLWYKTNNLLHRINKTS